MLIVVASPAAICRTGSPDPKLIQVLIKAKKAGNPVGLISIHRKPPWFDQAFGDSRVSFLKVPGRQDGQILVKNAEHHGLNPYDALVLAGNEADVAMGKNGGAVLLAAGWASDHRVQALGIQVSSAAELQEIIDLTANWPGGWWCEANLPGYTVRALADLSGYGVPDPQAVFAKNLTKTVKNGGARLNALLAITARSLLSDGFGAEDKLAWGVYPASHSKNDDEDTLSDFVHRLRTTVSQVHFARRGNPLFIRHKPSPKRSTGGGGDRNDPTNQITTLNLNPYYRGKLAGRHVVVVDDCTTYGVSFGVAAAFLKKAGAKKVTCVALGKFGGRLGYYDITLNADPFAPVPTGAFSWKRLSCAVKSNAVAQHALLELFE